MAELDDDLELTDEEKRRKKAEPEQSIGPKIAAANPNAITGPGEAPALPDTAPQAPPQLSSISGMGPLAPRPAGERLTQMTTQGAPEYHGFKRAMDTLAGATNIGTAIERAGGFGTQGYEAKLARAAGEAGLENTQIQRPEAERAAQGAAEHVAAQTEEEKARAAENQARATAIANPPVKPPAGRENPQQGYTAAIEDALRNNRDPRTDPHVQAWADAIQNIQKETQPRAVPEEDKAISDYLQAHKLPDTPANRDKARDVLKTRDRKPVDEELTDINKQMKRAQLEKLEEPTADEQRRADLARNMRENLDSLEEIVRRRPELFGPVAGRYTTLRQMAGTNDPDVGKLKTIREYLGMASVGAHAMRNAQHVGEAADAVMSHFINDPKVILASIEEGKKSTQTFLDDEQRRHNRAMAQEQGSAGPVVGASAPAGKGAGAPAPNTHNFTYNGTAYENVPDALYQKYKSKPGFKE